MFDSVDVKKYTGRKIEEEAGDMKKSCGNKE